MTLLKLALDAPEAFAVVPHVEAVAARAFSSSVAYVSVQVLTDARLSAAAPTAELAHRITQLRDAGLAVSAAGGISRDTIDEVAAAGPAVVVVGGAITTAQDPRKEALSLRQRLGP